MREKTAAVFTGNFSIKEKGGQQIPASRHCYLKTVLSIYTVILSDFLPHIGLIGVCLFSDQF